MNHEEAHHVGEVKPKRLPHLIEALPQGGEMKLYMFENGFGVVVSTSHDIPISAQPTWSAKIVERDPYDTTSPPPWNYIDALDEEVGENIIKRYLTCDQVEALLTRVEAFPPQRYMKG